MDVRAHFIERIDAEVLVADGGIGTLLHEKGISFDTCFDHLCLTNPELVRSIHCDYIAAGADIIETNSFGANAERLKRWGLQEKTSLINREAARTARSAREEMGRDVLVAGAIGPSGKRMIKFERPLAEELRSAFALQVEGLLEGGVDLFILETFSEINEIILAIDTVRAHSHLPLIAQMTFTYDGLTLPGDRPEEVARALQEYDVDVIGANCSVGPQPLIDVIAAMAGATAKPLSVMPNAGLPRYVNGRYLYYTTPEYFAGCAPDFTKLGVRVIGGCCGTSPAHIKALAEVVHTGQIPENRVSYQPLYIPSPPPSVSDSTSTPQGGFRRKLGKELVISVEIDPPRGSNPEKLIKGAKYLAGLGIDAINIADSPMGRVRMEALAAASLARQHTGLDIILHLTCRDHNLMGLQSTVLGANALGVQNILSITGDPPAGDYPNITAVYDVDAIGLLEIIKSLNEGRGITGAKIGYPTDIWPGAAVNPTAPDKKLEMERLRKKIDLGVAFFMTQPLFDTEDVKRFLDDVAELDIVVLLGILPLHSLRHALFLHNEVPGITIPRAALERIERAGEHAHEVGIDLAVELADRVRAFVDGFYFMPSFGRYETIGAVLARINLTSAGQSAFLQ